MTPRNLSLLLLKTPQEIEHLEVLLMLERGHVPRPPKPLNKSFPVHRMITHVPQCFSLQRKDLCWIVTFKQHVCTLCSPCEFRKFQETGHGKKNLNQ